MLRDAIHSIISLFIADRCICCGEDVTRAMHGLCVKCRMEMPLTLYSKVHDNPIQSYISNFIPVVEASAYIFFSAYSPWRKAIHRFKYNAIWRTVYDMGRLYGAELRESPLYDDVDLIIPIPLHPIRLLERSYNQSTYLAEGMSHAMGIPYDSHNLRRKRHNASQTHKTKGERWLNVVDLFDLRHPERLKGRHILLVDDVFTSGATTVAAARAIIESVPDCRISVATLAATRRYAQI